MLRKQKEQKRKSVAATLMRDMQGTAVEKLRIVDHGDCRGAAHARTIASPKRKRDDGLWPGPRADAQSSSYVLPVMVGLRQHRLVVERSLTGGIAF